ncbi:MAG: glycosyltransferase [Syntrophobacteraceae bacterium]|nr:glycosyltransferase [Syntrophobacteraceae bacterium]
MISVIIPTFNRAKLILEAVRSVLDQKGVGEKVEVIVVDDGSTDGSGEALEAVAGDIDYVRCDHSGVSAARNLGISRSRGEWIAFLDSDDLWLPGKLCEQMKFFAAHPDILLCQTEEIWMRNGKRINAKKYHRKPGGYCFSLLLERCLVSPSAVVIHRKLFDFAGLFDESLPACEDYDLWLRIGCRFPLGLVERPLVIKRGGHADQLSATIENLDRYRIEAIVKVIRSGRLSAEQIWAAEKILEEKRRIYCNGCRKRGNLAEVSRVEALSPIHRFPIGLPFAFGSFYNVLERPHREFSVQRTETKGDDMLFMAIFSYSPEDRNLVIERGMGSDKSTGVKVTGEWFDISGHRVFRLFEADDDAHLAASVFGWSDLGVTEIIPVMETEKALKLLKKSGKKS